MLCCRQGRAGQWAIFCVLKYNKKLGKRGKTTNSTVRKKKARGCFVLWPCDGGHLTCTQHFYVLFPFGCLKILFECVFFLRFSFLIPVCHVRGSQPAKPASQPTSQSGKPHVRCSEHHRCGWGYGAEGGNNMAIKIDAKGNE